VDTKKPKRDLATSGTIVYVEWVDAVADIEWQDNVKAEIHPCKSIGWVVDENKDALCIACTVSMESSNARIHIPKAWITKRKVITVETKQRKIQRKKPPAVDEKPYLFDVYRSSGK
jgi:hypothetical protein